MATAPKCSITSRRAVLPCGMRTSSVRSAKILPTYSVSLDTVSNSCSATGRGLLQQLRNLVVVLDAIRVLLGNVHARQPFFCLVVQRRADERDEQRMGPGRPALE